MHVSDAIITAGESGNWQNVDFNLVNQLDNDG